MTQGDNGCKPCGPARLGCQVGPARDVEGAGVNDEGSLYRLESVTVEVVAQGDKLLGRGAVKE